MNLPGSSRNLTILIPISEQENKVIFFSLKPISLDKKKPNNNVPTDSRRLALTPLLYLCSSVLAGSRLIKMKINNKSLVAKTYCFCFFPSWFIWVIIWWTIHLPHYLYLHPWYFNFLFQIYRQELQHYHQYPHPDSRFIKMGAEIKAFWQKLLVFFLFMILIYCLMYLITDLGFIFIFIFTWCFQVLEVNNITKTLHTFNFLFFKCSLLYYYIQCKSLVDI